MKNMRNIYYAYFKLMSLSPFINRSLLTLLDNNLGLENIVNFTAQDWRTLNAPDYLIKNWDRIDPSFIEAQLKWMDAQPDLNMLYLNDPNYPALLKQISDPPFLLFAQGNINLLHEKQIAIVGSRKASPQGLLTAKRFASALSQQGLTITSGLALGIDGAAHLGALESNEKTIAVLGTGLGKIYPRQHTLLAKQILQKALLVSEFPPFTPAHAKNFPARNRIISGLSLGTLVIEAAARSGSLITARLSAEQGREVFAIPGSILNPYTEGSNHLLQQGAHLVQSVEDILSILKIEPTTKNSQKNKSIHAPSSHFLLNYFDDAPTTIDCLIERSGLSASVVLAALCTLELQGCIARTARGFQIIAEVSAN